MRAARIIEHEHRSLAAVLRGLLFLVREIRFGGAAPNFELLTAMLDYIDNFSECFHHPKEDAYLFERLAVRHPAAAPLIERLTQDHRSGAIKVRELRGALHSYREAGPDAFPEFAGRVADYAAFHWEHMRMEEDELLPLAKVHLTDTDWIAVDAAFLGHSDPLFGVEREEEYQELFHRIVDLAPRPMGRAPAH